MDDLTCILLISALAAVTIAVTAWLADRRRMRRADPDAVGFMPWTDLFFWSAFAGFLLIVAATKAWFEL